MRWRSRLTDQIRAAVLAAAERTTAAEHRRGGRRLPWFVILGEEGGGKSAILRSLRAHGAHADTPAEAGTEFTDRPGAAALYAWAWLPQAVALEVTSRCLPVGDARAGLAPWRALTHALGRLRDRALDGIVLAIPAATLCGPDETSADRIDAAAAKGEWLAARVRELARATGRRVPLYVLITRCDAMPGFAEFVGAWPPTQRREIVGWSNAQPVDAPYDGAWLDHAWETIGTDLTRIQRQLLAADRRWDSDDALFRWPEAVATLREPARAYLEPFLAGPDDSAVFLRGVYLCGQPDAAAPAAPVAPAGTSRQLAGLAAHHMAEPREARVAFVRDLFEAKIFVEAGLGRESERASAARTIGRRIAVMTAAAVGAILLAGMGLAAVGLHDNAATLSAMLRESRVHLTDSADSSPRFLTDATRQVIARVADRGRHPSGKLASPFLPSSVLSPLHERLVQAMARIHEQIILSAVASQLEDRLARLIAYDAVDRPPPNAPHVEELPAARTLRSLLASLAELEDYVRLYGRLEQAKTIGAVGRLVRYTIVSDVPVEALDDLYYLNEGLQRAAIPGLHLAEHRAALTRRVAVLLERVRQEAVASQRMSIDLDRLAKQLDALVVADRTDARLDARALDDAAASLAAIQSRLRSPELAWLSAPQFDLGPAFQHDILDAIGRSTLLDRSIVAGWQSAADSTLRALQTEVAQARSQTFGPLLSLGAGPLRLNPEIERLSLVLADLYAQPFMAAGGAPVVVLRPRSDSIWDLSALLDIVRLYEEYATFRGGGLLQIPSPVQQAVHRASAARISDQMLSRLSHAERTGTGLLTVEMKDADLRSTIDYFERTTAALSLIERQLRELGMTDAARTLTDQVATQSVMLLTAVDHRLAEDALYVGHPPCGGRARPSLTAFKAHDAADLIGQLARQRDRVTDLARTYAKPLLATLDRRPEVREAFTRTRPEAKIVARWEGILSDLDRYERQEPGNAVAALERFVLVEMDRITPRNYAEKLTGDFATPVSRYFLERKNALRREMRSHCEANA